MTSSSSSSSSSSFSLILSDPVILKINAPLKLTGHGLSNFTTLISPKTDEIFQSFQEMSGLAKLLSKVVHCSRWHEYFDLTKLRFSWKFDGVSYSSSSPFFELFMTALCRLASYINFGLQTQEELDHLTFCLDLACKGLRGDAEEDEGSCIISPALIWPVSLRYCRRGSKPEGEEEDDILIGLSMSFVQALVDVVVLERWVALIEKYILQMMTSGKAKAVYTLSNIRSLMEGIHSLTKRLPPNHLQGYISLRLDQSNEQSDVSILVKLAEIIAQPLGDMEKLHMLLPNIRNSLMPQLTSWFATNSSRGLRRSLMLCTLSQGRAFELFSFTGNPSMKIERVRNNHVDFEVYRLEVKSTEDVIKYRLQIEFQRDQEEEEEEGEEIEESTLFNCCILT